MFVVRTVEIRIEIMKGGDRKKETQRKEVGKKKRR
jgi:hypothetical protein